MANKIQFILYNLPEGNGTIQAIVRDDTVWLTQKAMGELFGVGVPAISKHLKNIFESGELDENSVVSKMEITATDGKSYNTTFYSLDAIISVGYRVNSRKATFFRQWATIIRYCRTRDAFLPKRPKLRPRLSMTSSTRPSK